MDRCDVQNFRYDGLCRLTRAWTANDSGGCARNATNATSSSPAPYDVAYTYDVLGNRTTATATGVNGAVTASYTYSSTRPHQLLATSSTGAASATATYAYDAAGHQITRTTNSSKVDLTWDAQGELTSVGTDSSAVYDANGERLVRVDATGTTVYLPGGQELSINAGKVTATRYYTFAGQSVAVRTGRGLGGVTSLVADLHGTTLAAVPNGSWKTTSVIKQYTDPFGATRGTPAAVPGDCQFLDKTRDQTGLTLIGARYYDEHTGRFISLDPLLDLSDPQQWNGYAYANNNPTTWSDPTGLDPDTSAWITDRIRADVESGKTEPEGPVPSDDPLPAPRPGPYAPGQDHMRASEVGHLALDLTGLAVDGVDIANAAWYALEGDWENVAWSTVSVIPVAGVFGTLGKYVSRAIKAAKLAEGASQFGKRAHSAAGIAPYRTQRLLTRGRNHAIEAHHVIEKRFARRMGGNTMDWPAVVLTREEHRYFTHAWRNEIGYGAGTRAATRQQIEDAARRIYADYPEILEALKL
ncbi:RHS repeat-associated core domain-containing protein [Cellulomonas sp. PSBB021]|uniref:RHS repeat-associated core domain-containing protein n=1 Tax=Cellulomonas sp. PSBB021 TaxID=2003551 RepID=UPI0012FD02C4|nr:RHS repeat-associated core domain-containing protein [Cellulomonas sp. PSBB021]